MPYIAGVDGGQSSTRAAIADESGRILGRGIGPPADLIGERRDSQRQRNAIAIALGAALSDAGLSLDAALMAAAIGLTGHDDGTARPDALASLAQRVVVVHDTAIAHAGALGGEPGIVVLAGTGSVALGNAASEGPFVRAGGWGYFFGDEGSALWIARQAIGSAMRDLDDGESSQLGDAALRFFGAPDLRAIQHAFAFGELSRPALAAFAAEVLAMAPSTAPSIAQRALHLRQLAASKLVDLARSVHGRLPAVPSRKVSYCGGVFASDELRRDFRRGVERSFEGADVVEPAGDGLEGAVFLARRLLHGEPVETRLPGG